MTVYADPQCLFCKIAQGSIPAQVVFSDEQVVAFRDIQPRAPTHVLLIPRQHIATLNDLQEEHQALAGHLVLTAGRLAAQLGIADDGYRLVANCNRAGGQTVFHLHFHLLGGRSLAWPPG